MILEEPNVSMDYLMEDLRDYEEVIGMKVNHQKTKIIKNMMKQAMKELTERTKLQLEQISGYLFEK